EAARRSAWTGISSPHADETVRQAGRTRRSGGVSRIRRVDVCDRADHCRRRRIPRQRREPMSHVPALVISPRDNVATALEPLAAGQTIVLGDQSITITEATPRGHKIALRPIRQGEEIYKYGSTIGTATCDIQAGSHVHTHNVASGRGRAPQKNTE